MKKLIITSISFNLLFGVVGCDKNSESTASLLEPYRVASKAELEQFSSDWKYIFNDNQWLSVTNFIEEGKIAIDNAQDEETINTIVIDTKANIDALLLNEDFIITIEATTTSVVLGEDIGINVTYTNTSGKDIEISYFLFLFFPVIPNWNYPVWFEPQEYPSTMTIAHNGSYTETWNLGANLEVGKYDLRFRINYFLNWVYHDHEDNIEIYAWTYHVQLKVE